METPASPDVSPMPEAPQATHNLVAQQPSAAPDMESSIAHSTTTTIAPPPEENFAKHATYTAAGPAPVQTFAPNVRYPNPVPLNRLDEQAAWIVCPFCGVQSLTTIDAEPSILTQSVLPLSVHTIPNY